MATPGLKGSGAFLKVNTNMKLKQVQDALPAWQRVSGLQKPPKLALKLMRFGKKAEAELLVLSEARENLIYECAGVPKPTPPDVLIVQIQPTVEVAAEGDEPAKTIPNPQHITFWEKFNVMLDTEAELFPLDMTLEQFVEELSAFPGNAISEDDLELLEPFFTKQA